MGRSASRAFSPGASTRSVDTGPLLFPDVEANASGYRFKLFADKYDNPYFPRSGHAVQLSTFSATQALGSDDSYHRGQLTRGAAHSWGRHSLWIYASGATDFGTSVPAYDVFTLGGPLRMSGYRIDELQGRRVGFARAMYYNRTVKLPDLLGSGVYVGGSLEGALVRNTFFPAATKGSLWSGSAFLAAATALGPAFFGVGVASGRTNVYLLLGPP